MRRGLFVAGFTLLVAAAWSMSASAFPDPIGDCLPGDCPGEPYPAPGNGDFIGTDAAINVFVGGSMNVVQNAAESEGKLVVLGDLNVNKSSVGSYNIGIVGSGSRITPPTGVDHAVIGGDITVTASPLNTVHLGGTDSNETRWGNLSYGGTTTISQGDRLDLVPDGQLIDGGPTVTDPYASLRGTITDLSDCAETYETTGTVNVQFGTATFTGDGTSMLQVFSVPADLGTSGETVAIDLVDVPAGATTVINMVGTEPTIYLNSALVTFSVTPEYSRLVWNFPNASTAGIRGTAQVPGSILVGPIASTTTITTPGTNGRVLLAGNLVHGGGGGGEELHAYPFNGTLPPCDDPADDVDIDQPADVADFGTDTESDVDTDQPADVADFGTDTESDVDTDQPADDADLGTDTQADDAADDTNGGGVDPGDEETLPDTGASRLTPLLAIAGGLSLMAGTAISRRARRVPPSHRA
ncbi:hypothetical protein GCM10022234_36060 [Aeromicrobium panaciterrae]|uniref:choice-of-anchor A family protein n=1 Tax=Aeromicrobium panaciterrae TaxID=363861 RepID=UPI0031D8CB74